MSVPNVDGAAKAFAGGANGSICGRAQARGYWLLIRHEAGLCNRRGEAGIVLSA